MNRNHHLVAALLGAASANALMLGAAVAQTGSGDEIVVTGSRIVRSDASSPSPLSVVTSEEIDTAGTLSLTEVLRRDPSVGSQSAGPSITLRNAGRHSIDLRNLGGQRTLTLVNGKRIPLSSDTIGNAGQDVTSIPSAMIGRVEVLRDGASTAYGADAVAGVVNFIIDDRFDGMEVKGYAGGTDNADGLGYRFSGKVGKIFDGGSVLLVGEYSKQNHIPQTNRDWATDVVTSIGAQRNGQLNGPGGRVYATDGSLIACYPNEGGANVAPDCPLYDNANQQFLIGGTETRSLGGAFTFEVAENVELYGQGFFTNREGYRSIAASRQLDTRNIIGLYPTGFTIPATSTANPYGQDVNLLWRPAQYGPQDEKSESNAFWGSFGFKGVLADRFNWDVSHTYSRTTGSSTLNNVPHAAHLRNLLDSDLCAADAGCAAVGPIDDLADILSQDGRLTEAQEAYLFYGSSSDTKFSTQQTIATIGGALFSLPAGEVSAVIGYEHRKESGEIIPDSFVASGEAVGSFAFPGGGSFKTNEVFAELEIPLLADVPGVYRLDLNAQGRYSHFSNFGGAETYKIGLNYSPTPDIRIRGTYGTSFRAPDIVELYGGGTGGTGAFQDPCNASGLRATDAQIDANCDALGVPDSFEQSATSLPLRSGGNPALEAEKGRAYTIGAVITPSFLSGFTASVDYYNFKVTNAISGGQLQQNITACYQDPNLIARANDINDICYTFADRVSSGSLNRVLNRSLNLASLKTSGIDMSAQLALGDVGPGELTFDAKVSHLLNYNDGAGDRSGTYLGVVEGASSWPKWRGYASATYDWSAVSATWRVNYVSSMTDGYGGALFPIPNYLDYTGTPDYFTHDLLVSWAVKEGVDAAIGVNNVLDRDPPYAYETTRGTLPTTFDQLGRYFFGTVTLRF